MAKKETKKEPVGKDYGILGKATNPMEEEIAETILPLLTVENEDRIAEKKLTLSGCMQKCMENGHKYEVKTGRQGIARISLLRHKGTKAHSNRENTRARPCSRACR